MIRYSVRIKLTDFINSPYEEQIIATICSIGEETGKRVFLKLWYLKDEIDQSQIMAFIKKYEDLLEDIGTNIHMGEHESWTQKSWFNIRRKGTPSPIDYRHECYYNNAYGILEALSVFRVMLLKMDDIRAVQSTQPQKKESNGKQNGYRVTIKRVSNV